MSDPVLVEVTRGGLVESRHHGAVAVVDADGRIVLALGDVDAPVYPRSAVKALQALVLVESGAADRYGFGDEDLALACASHAGEPGHVAGVTRMLTRAGLSVDDLQCGAHAPMHKASAEALVRAGQAPSPLHHNCSGKHAGFLCAACQMNADIASYCEVAHPVQREVRAALEAMSGRAIPDADIGIDGCSVPTFAMPLAGLARAFARFATGQGLAPARAEAVRRLRAACAAKPWHVAGTGQFVTQVMEHFGARVFVKAGAEGAYCAALPEQGLGVAVKCDDGAGRAAEAITAAVLAKLLDRDARAFLATFARRPLRNWRKVVVGEIRPADVLALR
ncbi:MAG TPA: asparaginase [Xanthobacteraceae bacterium]|nr:asparaginase [Xanthobacteraceae bacterium]